MNLRYLLDTSTVSEPLRPRPSKALLRALDRHGHEAGIASIVWHELVFGAARLPASRRREAIERYLDDVVRASLPVVGYDRAAAEWHAAERARLERAGRMPPFVDAQIAAIAAANELTLVTKNERDFRAFRGLRVEDWT